MAQERIFNIADSVTYHKIIVDKLRVGIYQTFQREFPAVAENASVEMFPDWKLDAMIVQLHSYLLDAKKLDKTDTLEYQTPATPWQFFKERYLPTWFLKRWPVQYATHRISYTCEKHYMCPHLSTHETYPHAMWLAQGNCSPLIKVP